MQRTSNENSYLKEQLEQMSNELARERSETATSYQQSLGEFDRIKQNMTAQLATRENEIRVVQKNMDEFKNSNERFKLPIGLDKSLGNRQGPCV